MLFARPFPFDFGWICAYPMVSRSMCYPGHNKNKWRLLYGAYPGSSIVHDWTPGGSPGQQIRWCLSSGAYPAFHGSYPMVRIQRCLANDAYPVDLFFGRCY